MSWLSRTASRVLREGRPALAFLSIVCASGPVMAGSIAEGKAPARAPATAPIAEGGTLLTVTVVPRSEASAFPDTTLVYLDGTIDDGAPGRLSQALDGVYGQVDVWLNSPRGNLFAGMQLGRIIRTHGAWTRIIDYRTVRPGQCYSACALAFLGGVYRFNDHGARYGVHRASLRVDSPTGGVDLGEHLSTAIADYIREMGVDARLLALWSKAGPDEMYVLSQKDARDLGVVNNGRKPPEWSIVNTPGGALLQGQQETADGTGTLSFSCHDSETVVGSVYEAAGKGTPVAVGGWSHRLTVDRYEERSLKVLGVSSRDGIIRSTLVVSSDVVRRALSAKQIGHHLGPPGHRSLTIGFSIDIDGRSASMVKKFLTDCLRRQAKRHVPSSRLRPGRTVTSS